MLRFGSIVIFSRFITISMVMLTIHACGGMKTAISVQLAAGDNTTRISEITPANPKAGDKVTLSGKRFPTRTKNLIGRVVLADGATKDSTLTVTSETSASFTVPADAISSVTSIIMLTAEKTFATYDIKTTAVGTLDAVTFSPAAGTYTSTQSVTLTASQSGATIYYTTDGSIPTVNSAVYTAPISVATSQTITAFAAKTGFTNSSIASAQYTITPVADPVISVASGTYTSAQSVTLTSTTSGASIYYTTDGSTPTSSSNLYSTAISVSSSQTLKAIATKSGYTSSNVVSADYIINLTTVATPTFSVAAGAYGPAQSVTLSTATAGATIYYTTDGSTPTTTSSVYASAINVASTGTIKAYAVKAGLIDSGVGVAAYTINGAVQTPVATVAGGSYNADQSVTLATVPIAASIYYTTDGSTPDNTKTLYTGTITVSGNTVLKAIGIMADYSNSAVMTETYTLTVATPTADVNPGAYGPAQTVTLSSTTTGAVVHYTTDGSTPTCSSGTGSVSVSSSMTVKAIACKNNYTSSSVASFIYAINGAVATPTMSVTTGTFDNNQSVTLSSATGGSIIYYTTDGSTPDNTKSLYSGAITISATTILKAIAIKATYIDSAVATETYTMVVGDPTPDIAADEYFETTHVLTLSSTTTGATIYRTTNGSTPTCSGSTGTVNITQTMTVKAIACKSGYTSSAVVSLTYTINAITAGAVEAFPDTSNYPATSWTPKATFSITTGTDHVDFLLDSSSSLRTDFSIFAGVNSISAIQSFVTTLNQTSAVSVQTMSGSSNFNLGSFTTKLPPSFSYPGADQPVYVMVKDDKSAGCTVAPYCLIVGGDFTAIGNQMANRIARIKTNGSVESLGTGMDALVQAIAVNSLGHIYAGGYFSSAGGAANTMYIAKWDGSTWSSVGGGADAGVNSLVVDTADNLYATGGFTTAGGVSVSRIAKWNGTTWSTLGSGLFLDGSNEFGNALAIDGSNNLYVVGKFTTAGGVTVNNIAKWNGSSWSAFGTGVNNNIWTVSLDSSGNLYVGGDFTTAGGTSANYIAKWNGSSWSALGSGMSASGSVYAITFDGSGNLYAGGLFTSAGGIANTDKLAKWDGSNWSSMGATVDSGVYSLYFDGSGKLYIGGGFLTLNGQSINRIATWNGSSWSSPQSAPGLNSIILTLAKDSTGNIYAGGNFPTTGVANTVRIAKWNGSTWGALGTGMNATVRGLALDSTGNLYAGGDFVTAGGVAAVKIAKWDGSTWSALSTGMNGSVSALVGDSSGNLYAGGSFTSAGGIANTAYVAKWDGSSWNALGTGMNSAVQAFALDSSGNLYVGGSFTSAGGVANTAYVAKWNGSSWSALGTGMNGAVQALALDGSGNLYAGGSFTSAGGVAANRIAKWNGSSWSALGTGMNNSVSTLKVDTSGNLYAGGTFTTAGGVAANRIAKWDSSSWSALGTGATGTVYALTLDSTGNLYVGGNFLMAGSMFRPYFAKWITALSSWF